jgi:hypothetical protein
LQVKAGEIGRYSYERGGRLTLVIWHEDGTVVLPGPYGSRRGRLKAGIPPTRDAFEQQVATVRAAPGVEDVRVDGAARRLPSLRSLERWAEDCVAKATDGCRVEPDGTCPHGRPSWPLALGMI